MADLRPAFGRRIRELRLEREWSQEQLAERAGTHWTYVSGVERGRRNPSLNMLARLAEGLGVNLTELLDGLDARSEVPARPGQRIRRRGR